MRALIVTADDRLRSVITEALASHQVEALACPGAAVAGDAASLPLVIVDTRRPRPGIDDVHRGLMGAGEGPRPVTLAVTSAEPASGALALLDAGADDVLSWPADPATLALRLAVAVRRAAERGEELRSQRRLRLVGPIIERSPAMVVRLRPVNGRLKFEFVSDNVARLGYQAGAFLAGEMSFRALVHPGDRGQVMREVRACLDGGDATRRLTFRVQAADGTARWVDGSMTVAREGGRVAGVEATLIDITERRQVEDALRASEQRYRELFENASDIVYTHDLDGHFTSANRAAERLTGYARAEILSMNLEQIVAPDHLPLAREMMARKLASGESTAYELEIVARDGSRKTLDLHTRLIDEDGVPVGVQGIVRDVTERRRGEEALRESEERFRRVFEDGPIGMAIVDGKRRFRRVNAALCRMLGYTEEELIHLTIGDVTHPDDWAPSEQAAAGAVSGAAEQFQVEKRYLTKTGTAVWANVTGTVIGNAAGGSRHGLVMVEDITSRRALEEQLRQRAFYDLLTALPNRTLFIDRLEQALARARRGGAEPALLFLDLDGFKAINDRFGHEAGDQLLTTAGARLAACVRPHDTVARFGGDEFTILLDGIEDENDAVHAAQRMLAALRRPVNLDGREVGVTASIGIAAPAGEWIDVAEVLRRADIALYHAKTGGKNRYAVFSPGMSFPAPRPTLGARGGVHAPAAG